MRKFYTLLSGMLFILLFSTCKQFTEDIDVYLSYWASEAFVKSATIEAAHPHDKDGIASVASDKDVEITLRLQNPHKFQLQTPSTSKKKIVQFHHLSDMQPAVQTDFEMIQTTADTLQLIYKRDFLQRAEWGEKDLSSVITLYARDGRPFKQEYTVKIKANTPPPQITHYSVAKTKGTPAYYVLCLIVPDMDKKIPAGLLHKDIAQITVNGTHYALSVSEAQNAFVTPEGSPFIGYTDTEKLAEPDADEVPRSSAAEWVLYYKTDVEVKEGVRKKDYTVQLADAKALVTPVLQATTRPNKPEAVVVRISKGEKVDAVSGDGSSSANARVIKAGAGAPEAELTLRTPTSEALVYAAVTETRSGASTKYEGNTVKIPLALNGANEKTFKLAYYAGGAGFVPTLIKTVYYTLTQSYTVRFDAQGGAPVPALQAVLYGKNARSPSETVVKTGYTFSGWYKDSAYTGAAWNFATDTVSGNTTLYAKWTANGNTPYTVKHFKQDVTGSGYTEVVADSQTLHGTTGTNAAVPLKTYTGFEAGTYTPATIAADGSTVVAVKYNRKVYTVSFNANGGTPAPSNQSVRYEGKVIEPPTMSKTGYTFGGWYKDSAYTGAAWNFATDTVSGNTTLYAKWTANGNTPYTVKHFKQDVTGSGYTEVVADSQTLHGTTGTNAAVPLKTYTGFEAGTYTPATIAADGSTVIEVKYNRKVYTITFNANGGTPAPSNQFVRYEGTASTPSISKTGYTFGGWYKSSTYTGAAWNFASNIITADITLYAKWNPRTDTQYTVKHLKQDVTGSGYTEVAADSQTLQGTTGAVPAVPLKTYTGFQAGTYTPTTIAADGSTVVEVKYDRVQYTVSFNANGGTPAPSNQFVRYEGTASTPSISKTGYTFGGWYKSSTYTGAAWNFASNIITADITLYAKWNPRTDTQYTVKHLKQDVTGSGYTEVAADSQTLQGTTGAVPAVPLKTYTGFQAGTYTPTTIAADGSTVVEVKYDRVQYTVSFNANGGTPAPAAKSVRYEAKVTEPSTMSKTGYTFGGWYKEAACTTQWNFATDTVTGNTTLYAKWTGNPYTVHFDGNGHTGGSMSDKPFVYGTAQNLTANTFSKTGYTFAGWTGTVGGVSKTYSDQESVNNLTTVQGDIVTLTAQWTANTYTVHFDGNGHTGGSMSDQTFTYDEALKPLRQNTFTKANYRFTGWATSSSSSTVVHTDQQSVNNLTTTNGDVVNLYAVWVPLPKVTFKVEGGRGGKLKCTYDGTTQEASGNTEKYFIVEYSTAKSAAFEAEPDLGWILEKWSINPGPFNDGSQSNALQRAVTRIVSDVIVTVKFHQL